MEKPLPTATAVLIFTDGACSGNPGPGGWGAIILKPNDEIFEMGGREIHTTNNRMELWAAIRGLEVTREFTQAEVLTDSTYVISGITQWIWGWLKKGWVTAEGKEVVNVDLWQRLLKATQHRKISWQYVRGHVGIEGNERADEIAVQFSRSGGTHLFRGSLEEYGRNLRNIPREVIAPRRSVTAVKKAFSYLSLIGNTPMRHATWAECERRVKGQSGAKFKKTISAENEKEILRSWGFPAGLVD